MSTSFTIEHTWPVSRETVLEHLFDDGLTERVNEALSSADRRLVATEKHGDRTLQRFDVKATTDIPAAARKALKPEMLEWTEESEWDPAKEQFNWRILTKAMRDRVDCAGVQYYESVGGKTRRIVKGTIEIKIPLAGKIAEKVLVAQLEKSYEDSSRAEQAFFVEKARE